MKIIIGRRMSSDNSSIQYVKVYGHTYLTPRQTVVSWIESGEDVRAKNAYGPRVVIDVVGGIKYIKTAPDWTTKDNLGSLPLV